MRMDPKKTLTVDRDKRFPGYSSNRGSLITDHMCDIEKSFFEILPFQLILNRFMSTNVIKLTKKY